MKILKMSVHTHGFYYVEKEQRKYCHLTKMNIKEYNKFNLFVLFSTKRFSY